MLKVLFLWLFLIQESFGNNCFKRGSSVFIEFCIKPNSEVLTGDFDGNGKSDLLCRDQTTGKLSIRFSNKDPFEETVWDTGFVWCKLSTDQILIGDFNGDGRSDLLCHDLKGGYKSYAYATQEGHFTGSNFHISMGWCNHGGSKIHIGDFSGDGKDDILCHDPSNNLWMAYANSAGQIHSTSFYKRIGYCSGDLHVGYFNKDKRADIMCANAETGVKHVQMFTGSSFRKIYSIDNSNKNNWCSGKFIFSVADINGDGLTDIICRNYDDTAPVWVLKNTQPHYFDNTKYLSYFCHANPNNQFLIGDYTGDKKQDMLCHNVVGTVQVAVSHCI